jgi:hypothetical protein
LGQLVELGQQILGAGERDVQVARFQCNPGRKACDLPAQHLGLNRDSHPCRGLIAAELIDLVVQAFFALNFHLKLVALGQPLELLNQYLSVDEECPPSLVTAETVKQLDCPTAPQSKQTLDDGPVNHGHNE